MNLSAILVVTQPEDLRHVCAELDAQPGLDVHHVDEANGRAILTQEAPTVEDEVAGLERLQRHPSVVLAEMVEHHFDNDSLSPEQMS